jgi:hypothetical protein
MVLRQVVCDEKVKKALAALFSILFYPLQYRKEMVLICLVLVFVELIIVDFKTS